MSENVHDLNASEYDDDDHDPSPPGIGATADMSPDTPASLTPGSSPVSA